MGFLEVRVTSYRLIETRVLKKLVLMFSYSLKSKYNSFLICCLPSSFSLLWYNYAGL
jgi:hypothetical protein